MSGYTPDDGSVRWGPYVSGLDCDICAGIFDPPCPYHPTEQIVDDLRQRWWAFWRALGGR